MSSPEENKKTISASLGLDILSNMLDKTKKIFNQKESFENIKVVPDENKETTIIDFPSSLIEELKSQHSSIDFARKDFHTYGETDIIQLNNINQSYEDKKGEIRVVFDNLNLKIKDVLGRPQFVAIIGESGCGKSTILRYIAGLQQPTSGEIFIKGNPQTPQDRAGMVFQQYSSLPWLTVLENVALSLSIQGVSKNERDEKAMEMIKIVGLEGHEYKFAQYPILSGGQLQRVAIARSLVANSDILLMDEPFSALDIKTRLSMQDLLRGILPKIPGDPTIVFVGHDLSEVVYLADEIYIMGANPGRIIETVQIDLPDLRTRELKRDKKFSEYVYYLEDFMMKLENKNK